MRYVTATPAYGVDYTSAKAVRAAWNEGRDFRVQDPFLSGYVRIIIRADSVQDAESCGSRLLAEWGLAGIARLDSVTEVSS